MELYFLLLLFLLMMIALGFGFPVAFALPGSAILSIGLAAVTGIVLFGDAKAFFHQDGPIEWLSAGIMNFRAIYYDFERDTLIAIPLFIFMGIMLQRSRIAEDLLMTMAGLFGPVPGGLGISVVFVGALLAATTGIVGATVVAMGLISLPSMMRNNYSPSLATGTICASGTLGQIIPPSIVLIILADQLGSASDQASAMRQALYKNATGEFTMPSALDVTSTSAGNMFLGAFLPGIVLVLVYFAYILITAVIRPKMAPAVPNPDGFTRHFFYKVMVSLVPPLVLIFLVLGSIIMGVATVNQAGAIGAIGATIMAGYKLHEGKKGAIYPALIAIGSIICIFFLVSNFDLNVKNIAVTQAYMPVTLAVIASIIMVLAIGWSTWRTFKVENTLNEVMIETAKTTSMVFIILLGAAMLTAAFRGFGGEEYVRDFLQSLPGGFWSQFIVVMAVMFILGFFLDFIEIAVVVVPIVAPILLADPSANITAVWLGVMIGVNIQTSFLTPPFGFALFYLRGVASKAIRTISIYKGVVPFIILQLIALGIVGTFPSLVNYLPNRFYLSSYNAPPPMNPRLTYCVERHLATVFAEQRPEIDSALATLQSADLSSLPKDLKVRVESASKAASGLFKNLNIVADAQDNLNLAKVDYAALHTPVREIERDVRKIDKRLKRLKSMRQTTDDIKEHQSIDAEMTELNERKKGLLFKIPSNWNEIEKAYQAKVKVLTTAQRKYRRSMDDGYNGVVDAISVIKSGPKFEQIKPALFALRDKLVALPPKQAAELIKAESNALFGDIAGVNAVKSLVGKARRLLKKEKAEKGMEQFDKALVQIEEEIAWRAVAVPAVLPVLQAFEDDVRMTIGLRSQDRLPDYLVPQIARCRSAHRNISLNF